MLRALGRSDPVSVTGHYLAPGRPGRLRSAVAPLRSGRRFASARALLSDSDGHPVLAALGTFGDLGAAPEPNLLATSPPELPPPEHCVGSSERPREAAAPLSFMDRVDLRLHPEDAGFYRGAPSGEARVRGWFAFADPEPVDTIGLLCVLDAFPPTVFNAALPLNWVPTLEFTAHVRRRPAPGPLACEFTTRLVSDGFLEEDGLVWDSTGAPVAQSRQLALVPRG